jgi:predicted MFS family arabinose efflux permease
MLFHLYIAQTIPMCFFSTAIPVIMRQEDFPLSIIGMIQLIKLPWIIKFLWAPMVDCRCRSGRDYKRWIVGAELVYALFLIGISCLDLATNFTWIIVLVIFSLMTSATQDIATDALAIRLFDHKGKGLANSMQSMGSFGGAIVGSGLALIILQQLGWSVVLPALALFVLMALIPLWRNKQLDLQKRPKHSPASMKDIIRFFQQPRIGRQLFFLLFFYAGIIGLLAMLRPYMVDLGYDLKQIGWMSGIVGTSCAFLTSFATGFMVRRRGRAFVRRCLGSYIFLATLFFVSLSFTHPSTWQLYIAIMLLWSSYGAGTVIVYTTAMDVVRPGREGTDFTLQIVITHLAGILISILSGFVAEHYGYASLFMMESSIAFLSLIYIFVVPLELKKNETVAY